LATDICEAFRPSLAATASEERTLLEAAIRQNVDAAICRLALGTDPVGADAPAAAVEEALRLAKRGVSILAFVRAYRSGHRRFLRRIIEDLLRHNSVDEEEAHATLALVDRVSDYVVAVLDQLLGAYSNSRQEWINPGAILGARVRSVLSATDIDVDTAQSRLGAYRLYQHHLAAEIWASNPEPDVDPTPLLRRLADAFATAAQCKAVPLFVPFDKSSACIWLPLGEHRTVDRAALRAALDAVPGTFAAVGDVASGLTGFRRTHQQALSAEAVARANTPPLERLTSYAEVSPIASMSCDLDTARSWIAETLGSLAIDDARHASFRETARVFLESGGSYVATAERLSLHRNTIQYRVRTAEEMRGRPFASGRLDVELALLACRWFGRIVLHYPVVRRYIGEKYGEGITADPSDDLIACGLR